MDGNAMCLFGNESIKLRMNRCRAGTSEKLCVHVGNYWFACYVLVYIVVCGLYFGMYWYALGRYNTGIYCGMYCFGIHCKYLYVLVCTALDICKY